MQDPLTILTFTAVILLGGVLISALAKRLDMPDVLLFVLFGLYLGSLQYNGQKFVALPLDFITGVAILALVMVVFDATSKINIHSFDVHARDTLKLVLTFTLLTLFGLSLLTSTFFGTSIAVSVLFATIMAGTAPSVILPLISGGSKTAKILRFESLVNTPLTVLLPFLVLDIMTSVGQFSLSTTFIEQLGPFLAKFVTGIGAGIFVGIILFQTIKHAFSKTYSPLSVMIAALLAYVLAENLGGNGVLSVTTLGIFFGNTITKSKLSILEAGSVLARSLYILIFVMLGSAITLRLDTQFILLSLILFALYIGIRYIAIHFVLPDHPTKEKTFMACMASKGIGVAVVAFALTTSPLTELTIALDLTVMFMLYSLILATIVGWKSEYFLVGQ